LRTLTFKQNFSGIRSPGLNPEGRGVVLQEAKKWIGKKRTGPPTPKALESGEEPPKAVLIVVRQVGKKLN